MPESESEHSIESVHETRTKLLVEVDKHFRVAVGLEIVAPRLEVGPFVLKVKDLPIEGDPDLFALVAYRLMSCFKVDDFQSGVRQSNSVVLKYPGIVWPAMSQSRDHRVQSNRRILASISRNSAHFILP